MSEEKPKEEKKDGGRPPYKGKPQSGGGRPQRGPPLSPAQQRRRAAEERISNWTPKTELGRKVVAGEITTVEEALATGLPLREPPIVDLLIPDLSEEVIDIHMVQRMSDSGRRVRFAVTTIVGNENGVVGLGRVSGKLVRPTITKALDRAKMNIIEIRRGSGSWECSTAVPNSLPFEVSGRTGSTRVTIKPAPPGVGLVTNQVGQIMLKLAGVQDAWSFTKGQTQTIYNFASAMFKALEKTSTTKLLPGQDEFHNMIKGVKQE
jgi:small subunit ribosomal protein S5|tara:strand:+ start:727 stop:1515 length:789 start_codon:yes stop_codon:yes gene_type:complete